MSDAQERPIPRCYFPPLLIIAYSTSFKLSEIVSKGQTKVPSEDSFNAAYPPLPLTIPFRIAWRVDCNSVGSVTFFAII